MVPNALRTWFVVHFIADWLFALPMFFIPVEFMQLLGWDCVDPVATRIAAAALFGIGTQSFIDRNATIASFKTMLEMKIIWSGTASVGLLWSALTGSPPMTWGLLLVFVGFNANWTYWRLRLARPFTGGVGAPPPSA